MKTPITQISLILALALLGSACAPGPDSGQGHSDHDGHDHAGADHTGHDHAGDTPTADDHAGHDHGAHGAAETTTHSLDIVNASKGFKAGPAAPLSFVIRDESSGEVAVKFDTVHEKPLHLFVVDEGLTSFQHLHPTMDAEGFWTQSVPFPHGGKFLAFAETSVGGKVVMTRAELDVEGAAPGKPSFALSASSIQGPFKAQVKEGTTLPLSDHAHISVKLTPSDAWEPYLGESGHVFMISQDGKEVIHAHPKADIKDGEVVFDAHFHKEGLYRAWGQFKRGGKVVSFPFTLEVKGAQ